MAVDLRFWRAVTSTPGAVELRFGAAPTQTDVTATLSAALPAAQPPALALSATGNTFARIDGALAATLPPPDLSLTFEAVEAPIGATIAAPLPAPTLPALELAAAGYTLQAVTLAATLPPAVLPALSLELAAIYDSALPDAVGPRAAPRHASARPLTQGLVTPQQAMQPAQTAGQAPHTSAVLLPVGTRPREQHMAPAHRPQAQRHQHGAPLAAGTRPRHAEHDRTRTRFATRHASGLPRAAGTRPRHAEQIRARRRLHADHQATLRVSTSAAARAHNGLPVAAARRIPHTSAIPLPVGLWRPSPGTEPPPPPSPYSSPVHLLFWRLNDGTTNLRFGTRPPAGATPVVVPVLRSYIVLNNVSLTRVSNSLPIPALSLQISIDADSWGWGWSASVPAAQLDNLLPAAPGAPIELEAQINGVTWRLLAERIARDRRHGADRLNVSGRGIAAELAAPLYPESSRDNTGGALTAQQLAAAALSINGVPLGWTLDWQIPDWLVPAGAWVHHGTPMDAVVRIAQAAGGYVQADPALKTLHIKKRYPVLPWNFAPATPDFILPSSATTREATEYVERPDYNVVYVAGTALGGVLGQVKKTGSAGDLPAEMVVDPLITHVDAARGRGESILGDTGSQQILTLETPVLEQIGVYPVGALIEWQEGASTRRGLVRSLSIAAALPRVRQTIEVEVHG